MEHACSTNLPRIPRCNSRGIDRVGPGRALFVRAEMFLAGKSRAPGAPGRVENRPAFRQSTPKHLAIPVVAS